MKKGLVHIYASFNNTIIHVTDATGAETLSRVSAGIETDKGRLQGDAFPAMKAADTAVEEASEKGIEKVDIRVRAPGGQDDKIPGQGAQPAIRAISQNDAVEVGNIENVTPVPHDSCREKGGKRGRRV